MPGKAWACLWNCWREFDWPRFSQSIPLLPGEGSHGCQGPTPNSEQWLFSVNGVVWHGQRPQRCFLCSLTPIHSKIMYWLLFICQGLRLGNQNYIRYTLCLQRAQCLEEIRHMWRQNKCLTRQKSVMDTCAWCWGGFGAGEQWSPPRWVKNGTKK